MTNLKHIAIAIVIVVVLYYLTCPIGRSIWTPKSKVEILLFYRDDCPHCVRIKPEWARFEEMVNGGDITVRKLQIYEHSELATKYKVAGVPYIIRVDGHSTQKYTGPRTAEGFYQFALYGIQG